VSVYGLYFVRGWWVVVNVDTVVYKSRLEARARAYVYKLARGE
jgi:hypothetical protein